MMDCITARAGLWPPERPRLVGAEVEAARRHVDGCSACQEYFRQDRELLEMYDRVRSTPAPLHLRERVYDELSRARWSRIGKRRSLVSGGAAIAAVLAVSVIGWPRDGVTPVATPDETAVFVEDYLRRAVSQEHIVTDDPAQVQRFLERELGVPVRPLAMEGLRIARAEVCLLDGELGAMIVYKRDGVEVSHYVVPRSGLRRAPALAGSATADGTAMPVVTWSTARAEQALVGGLESDSLLRIARLGSSEEQ